MLTFWFDEVGPERWFVKSDALDAEIARRFGALRDELLATKAKAWRDTPNHLLAAIIVLDHSRATYTAVAPRHSPPTRSR